MRVVHNVGQVIQEGTGNTSVVTRGGVPVYHTITEHEEGLVLIAPATENQAVSLGGVASVTSLYVEADHDVTVKLGATDHEAISVKAGFPLALVMATGVAAVYISNPGATQTAVKVAVGG
jgi:hypothetical protein